jgi:hypothetical protein
MPDSYELTIEDRSHYLHARVEGTRTPENAMRFLKESGEACRRLGRDSVLLEMNLAGPSLGTSSIFGVISQSTPSGLTLRRVAYVEPPPRTPSGAEFAETIAKNRGVNVRLFRDVAGAHAWLSEEP